MPAVLLQRAFYYLADIANKKEAACKATSFTIT